MNRAVLIVAPFRQRITRGLRTQAHFPLLLIVPTVPPSPLRTGANNLFRPPRKLRRETRTKPRACRLTLRNLRTSSTPTPLANELRRVIKLEHPPPHLLRTIRTLPPHPVLTLVTRPRTAVNLGTVRTILRAPITVTPDLRVKMFNGSTTNKKTTSPPTPSQNTIRHQLHLQPVLPKCINASTHPEHFNPTRILPSTLTPGEVKTTPTDDVWLTITRQFPLLETLPMVPQTLLRTGPTRSLCPPNSLFLGLKHPCPKLRVLRLPRMTVLLCPDPTLVDRNIRLSRQAPHTPRVLRRTVLILPRYPPEIRSNRLPATLQVGTPPNTHLTLTNVNPRVRFVNE